MGIACRVQDRWNGFVVVGGEEEGRPALLDGGMVASREDNGSQHDIHGISYRRGAAGERRQTTTWAVGSEE